MINPMISSLFIIHRRKDASGQPNAFAADQFGLKAPVFVFETCLRRILISSLQWHRHPIICSDDEYLEGHEAYEFLLQVISGLHSPVIGETEVLGQFRQQVDETTFNAPYASLFYQHLSRDLFEDVKSIRQEHLKGIGHRSYGSLCRKLLKSAPTVHLVGSGHLAKEILPWLIKGQRNVVVHCRNLEKASAIKEAYPTITLQKIGDTFSTNNRDGLVIAAPVDANTLGAAFNDNAIDYCIDLRDESAQDPIDFAQMTMDLKEAFALLEESNQFAQTQMHAAKKGIASCVQERINRVNHRPFGWDDLCA